MAGFVKSAVVEQAEVKAGRIKGGEMVEKELKGFRIECRQLQKETRPAERFHRALQIQTLKAIGGGQHRLDAASGNPMPHDGQESAAAFILRPHATARVALLVDSADVGLLVPRRSAL